MKTNIKVGIAVAIALASVAVFVNHSNQTPSAPVVNPIAHTNVLRPNQSPADSVVNTPSSIAPASGPAAQDTATSPQPSSNQPPQAPFLPLPIIHNNPPSTTNAVANVPDASVAAQPAPAPNAAPDPTAPNIPTTQPAPGTLTEVVPGGWYANSDPGSLQQPVLMPASSWPGTPATAAIGAHTMILVLDPETTSPAINAAYNTPAQIQAAYDLPATGGSGVIAIVDAYHDANALSDFNTFAKYFSLPVETSTSATASTNKVFQQVYATGTAPVNNTVAANDCLGWVMEISLDIEYAHAMAPSAKIVLVEANSASWPDLMKAIQVANAYPGVKEVSMSFGAQEFAGENSYDSYFTQTGVTYFAGGGDTATTSSYPAHSPNVIGVGGTTLTRNSAGVLQSETTWNATGFGLSPYETRPSYQSGVSTQVGTKRGGNDVAFLANPNTGVYIFDSTAYDGMVGWSIIGGTSLSTPCWAGIANQAGTINGFPTNSQAELTRIYANLGNNVTMRDITSGAAGTGTATFGWDQPTGLGCPRGLVGK